MQGPQYVGLGGSSMQTVSFHLFQVANNRFFDDVLKTLTLFTQFPIAGLNWREIACILLITIFRKSHSWNYPYHLCRWSQNKRVIY